MDSGESFCDLCTRLGLHDTPLIDIIEEIDRLRTFIAEKDKEIKKLKDERDGFKNGQQQMQDINCQLFKANNALGKDVREKDREIERLQTNIDVMKRALRWSECEEDWDG